MYKYHALRGGSWNDLPVWAHSSNRLWDWRDNRSVSVGLRLVRRKQDE